MLPTPPNETATNPKAADKAGASLGG